MLRRTYKRPPLLEVMATLRVAVANPDAVRNYLGEHPELPPVIAQLSNEVRQALPDVLLMLELVYDPEDSEAETLLLYLQPQQVDQPLLDNLQDWNHKVAKALTSSGAWFLVNLDLRSHK